jgi:hypothetical protein
MFVKELGRLIDPIEYERYIDAAETLETVEQIYGTPYRVPDYPCWMTYGVGTSQGDIAFTRHTWKHEILTEFTDKVVGVFGQIFPSWLKPMKERVHIIRTTGSIPVHKDEGGRMSCLNVGLRNSSTAITRMSNDGIRENFESNHTDYMVKDGFGYLLNTNAFHSVISTFPGYRYLITYGFGEEYSKLVDHIKVI